MAPKSTISPMHQLLVHRIQPHECDCVLPGQIGIYVQETIFIYGLHELTGIVKNVGICHRGETFATHQSNPELQPRAVIHYLACV